MPNHERLDDLQRQLNELRAELDYQISRGAKYPLIVCEAQNEIQIITIFGSPTGGTFDLDVTVDGTEEAMTFNWDDTAAEVKTELETHSKIASGDVACTAGPFPDAAIKVEFQGARKETDIPIMMADHGALTGGTGVGVLVSVDQHGRA